MVKTEGTAMEVSNLTAITNHSSQIYTMKRPIGKGYRHGERFIPPSQEAYKSLYSEDEDSQRPQEESIDDLD